MCRRSSQKSQDSRKKYGEFEKDQRITARPLKKCPDCRAPVKRLIPRTDFSLCGVGWATGGYWQKL